MRPTTFIGRWGFGHSLDFARATGAAELLPDVEAGGHDPDEAERVHDVGTGDTADPDQDTLRVDPTTELLL
jgi:hypothetical protein